MVTKRVIETNKVLNFLYQRVDVTFAPNLVSCPPPPPPPPLQYTHARSRSWRKHFFPPITFWLRISLKSGQITDHSNFVMNPEKTKAMLICTQDRRVAGIYIYLHSVRTVSLEINCFLRVCSYGQKLCPRKHFDRSKNVVLFMWRNVFPLTG